jgi:hypothetical protein
MHKVIDQNEVFRKFDFSSLITEKDNQEACGIIKQIIDSGNYFKNSPRFQTQENLFLRPESVWLKYRMSFLFSVFLYLGKEVKVGNMSAWSYMTNNEVPEDRNKLWHHHWYPKIPNAKMMSGIWYLYIPDDVKDRDYCGTEMAQTMTELGPIEDDQIFIRPTDYNWLIYPSDKWHRPGPPQSKNYRFIIAVDVEYLP